MTRNGGVRLGISVGLLCLVALASGAVVAVLILLPGPTTGSSAQARAQEGSVRVASESYDGARQVSVTASVSEAGALTTTESGRITASTCEPGGAVESGDVLLVVDDRPVIALATRVPLWRDLRTGSRGDDVRALQAELARQGHALEADGDYGSATREAVRSVQESAGMERPDGAVAARSIVWLPAAKVVVSECFLRVGDRAEDGEVAALAGGLTALTVVEPPGDGWVLRYDGSVGPIDAEGVVRDAELLAAVERSEMFRQGQDEGTDRMTMEIGLAQEIEVAVVPPSAVVAGGDGLGCIQADDGGAHRVEVVASSLGQTMVRLVEAKVPSSVRVQPDDVEC